MMALVAGVIALAAAVAFFVKRDDFVRARMIDRRERRHGLWASGLRPLNRRDALIAAWGAITLCLIAAAIMLLVGIGELR